MEAVFLLIILGVGAAIIGARGVAHERHGGLDRRVTRVETQYEDRRK